jgi:DNA ligase (NAD+)
MDIENLGEKIISDFVDKGWLTSISDIYTLETKREAILAQEGWKERSTENLLASIEKSKKQPFEKVLYSLGIKFIGERGAKLLTSAFPTVDRLKLASREDLLAIHEVGDKMADSVMAWFGEEKNLKLIDELKQHGLSFEMVLEEQANKDALAGQTFVFTGELANLKRSEAAASVERFGGREVKSVSKKTGTVVAGINAGSKLTKANELDIKVITEQEFTDLIQKLEQGSA